MNDYAARIRAARAYAGLSQPELAEQLGVDVATIKRREADGGRAPKRGELLAIASICSVPLAFLERGFGEMSANSLAERLDRIESALLATRSEEAGLIDLEPAREMVRAVTSGLRSDGGENEARAPSPPQEPDPHTEESSQPPARAIRRS